ncbi:MAG: type II secretion system GspH family protein [Candidatus Saccharibacteria bacterium]|jgi:Tfp pilus assembly protein PilE|nr:type II secretion system GspH family protein [Candidatus Saccharibacteria bacterium]
MKTRKAFTVLELMLCIIFVGIFVVLFFMQKVNVDAMSRDEKRKVAINAIYYALEEGYYDKNQYYPEKIDKAEILPWIDPNLFTDPYGVALWKEGSNYTYEAKECEDEKCKSYELRSIMEKEEDFVKTSRN